MDRVTVTPEMINSSLLPALSTRVSDTEDSRLDESMEIQLRGTYRMLQQRPQHPL